MDRDASVRAFRQLWAWSTLQAQVAAVLDRCRCALEDLDAALSAELSPLWAPLVQAIQDALNRIHAMQRYVDAVQQRLVAAVQHWAQLMARQGYPLPAAPLGPPDPPAEDDGA